MNEHIVSKFIGKNVVAEIEDRDNNETFVVRGELMWDDVMQLHKSGNKVTIAGEDEAISVYCSDINNLKCDVTKAKKKAKE